MSRNRELLKSVGNSTDLAHKGGGRGGGEDNYRNIVKTVVFSLLWFWRSVVMSEKIAMMTSGLGLGTWKWNIIGVDTREGESNYFMHHGLTLWNPNNPT